ncbi:MAG TPA: hypothetical protein VL463_36060 [Kofleriaceae bacterium]|nr:hypothetical protein [Kofleriaceae bacterium]
MRLLLILSAFTAQLTLDIPDAKHVRIDGVAYRVIGGDARRVRIVQDVDGLRLAILFPRRYLQRVAIREIGLARHEYDAAPSGDDDGVYARSGLVVDDGDQGDELFARVHVASGGVRFDGWIAKDATGFEYTPDTHEGASIAGEGTTITSHGRRLAKLDRATSYDGLDGKRAAIFGDGWIVRGAIELRAHEESLAKFRHGVGADPAQGPILRLNDCLYDDGGDEIGIVETERDTVPVDAHGDFVVTVKTVAGPLQVHAHGDGHGGFVSCDP